MKNSFPRLALVVLLLCFVSVSEGFSIYTEEVIWEPNNKLGQFTDLPSQFDDLLNKKDDPATLSISGGGNALYDYFPAPDDPNHPVDLSSYRDSDGWIIVEITDSDTYYGNIHIDVHSKVIIRAKDGETPVIECSRNFPDPNGGVSSYWGDRGIYLGTSIDHGIPGSLNDTRGAANNIGIIGIKFQNIPSSNNKFRGAISNYPRESDNADPNLPSDLHTILISDCYFYNEPSYNDDEASASRNGGGMAITLVDVDNVAIIRTKCENMAENTGGTGWGYAAIFFGPINGTNPEDYSCTNIYLKNVWIKSRGNSASYNNHARGINANAYNVFMEYVMVQNLEDANGSGSNGAFKLNQDSQLHPPTTSGTWSLKNCVATKCNRGVYQDFVKSHNTGIKLIIDHCVFNESYETGVRLKGLASSNSGDVTLKNSIISNGYEYGLRKYTGTNEPDLLNYNNDVWGNVDDYKDCSAGSNSVSVDPQFNNAAILDFGANAATVVGGGDDGLDMGVLFTPTHVWVYNGWDTKSNGDVVDVHTFNKIFGYNAFDNIADGVANVDLGGTVTVVVDNLDASNCGNEDNDYTWSVNGEIFDVNIIIENGGFTCSEHKANLTINNSAGNTPVQIGSLTAGNGTTIDLTGAVTITDDLVLGNHVAVNIGDDPFKVIGDIDVGSGSYIKTNDNGPLVLTLQPGVATTFPLMFGDQYSPVIITSGIEAVFRVSGRLLGDNFYNTSTRCLWSIEGQNGTNSTIVFLYPQSVVPDDFDMNDLMCYRLVGHTWHLFGEPTTTEEDIGGVPYYRSEVTDVNNFSEWGIFDKDIQPVPLPWWAILLLGVSLVATGGYYIYRRLV
jgi:hypothetical protein